MSIHRSLQLFVQNETVPISVPALVATPVPPIAEHIREKLAQGVTPNGDNLSAAWCTVSAVEEHRIFVTRVEVEALVR